MDNLNINSDSQTGAAGNQPLYLPKPSMPSAQDGTLFFDYEAGNPVIHLTPWDGINSSHKVWLYCECTDMDGRPVILKLLEAVQVGESEVSSGINCELPLIELVGLKTNSTINIILMVSIDGSRQREALSVSRHELIFQKEPLVELALTASDINTWMTNFSAQIEVLKLQELILPSAHNAGVDMDGASWPATQWAVCQDHTFSRQLAGGIRVLDLRVRSKYSDGNIHSYILFHGSYDAGRTLFNLMSDVKNFVDRNPLEIVIMDFHEIKDADIDRMASYFNIHYGDRLIPPAAKDLTIGQIRKKYPGRNLIIAWGYGQGYWPKINHKWNGQDMTSPNELAAFMRNSMIDPPVNQLWSMQAACYDWLGPMRLSASDHNLWGTFFNALGNDPYKPPTKGNIINVDFFEGTGVVNRCIEATLQRAAAKAKTAVQNLHAANITDTSIQIAFQAPITSGSTPVNYYQIAVDGINVGTTTTLGYNVTDLIHNTQYWIEVTPFTQFGASAPASIEVATKFDKFSTPRFWHAGTAASTWVRLDWAASTGGVKGYEIARTGAETITTTATNCIVTGLAPRTSYRFEVRASDFNGNRSDAATIDMTTAEAGSPNPPSRIIFNNSNPSNPGYIMFWPAEGAGYPITAYQLIRNGQILFEELRVLFNMNDLIPGADYLFEIRSRDSRGVYSQPARVHSKQPTSQSSNQIGALNLRTGTATANL